MWEKNSMASKRSAKNQLTQDNWEDDEDKEEPGTFKKADSEAIGKRIIKKAIRRTDSSIAESENKNVGKSPFSNFSLTSKPFSFTNTKPANGTIDCNSLVSDKNLNNTDNKALKKDSTTENSFKISPFVVNGQTTSSTSPFSTVNATPNTKKSSHSSQYYKQLAALNKSVSDWIKQHVDKNQYCILTPIFKDYEKHLKDIEKLSPENSPDNSQSGGVSFNEDNIEKKTVEVAPVFGQTSTFSTFSFGNTKKPFSFAPSNTDKIHSNEESADSNDNDADDIPPVPEVVTFQEEGSVYSTKCKLFYKKNDAFVDKGVGTLFIKVINDKTQLLVRADTTLGKILLNISLTKNIPCSRLGKNNISMICVLNPPLDVKNEDPNKPVSLLIRVKSEEDAENLLAKLNEYKV